MNGRKLVRLPFVLALVLGLGLSALTEAQAQTPTDRVAKCLSDAADALVQCTKDLSWYAEGLCYARYAADSLLCAPSIVFKPL